ncbi:histone-lysine N-methyltransferase SETMAR-like [Drosophila rhopaloa]|uniref:Histone-lysine N-methyltransferase SETMAR-like n=1 Tax=Drosophila rhopaloa TaxID=1041015 RepID=A0ABM5J3P9_DRORH|nr:histone-lysine N-methyltransferase SETMAR-like [Drosophila rhopaloa]
MDKPVGGRPVTTNTDQIMENIEIDRHRSRDIAEEIEVSHQTVLNHLQKAGYKKKAGSDGRKMDHIRQLSKTVAKPGLTAKKVLLCVWWDWKGIIHYELLSYGQTLNSTIYCEQLDRLKLAIVQSDQNSNRKGVVFHQDNARPHTSLMTRQKLRELGWEILSHPPYGPDKAPSDCSCLWRMPLLV